MLSLDNGKRQGRPHGGEYGRFGEGTISDVYSFPQRTILCLWHQYARRNPILRGDMTPTRTSALCRITRYWPGDTANHRCMWFLRPYAKWPCAWRLCTIAAVIRSDKRHETNLRYVRSLQQGMRYTWGDSEETLFLRCKHAGGNWKVLLI